MKIDLADPDFEPTDEQLIGLSKRAFAHVPAENRRALQSIRDEIATLRDAARARSAGKPR